MLTVFALQTEGQLAQQKARLPWDRRRPRLHVFLFPPIVDQGFWRRLPGLRVPLCLFVPWLLACLVTLDHRLRATPSAFQFACVGVGDAGEDACAPREKHRRRLVEMLYAGCVGTF